MAHKNQHEALACVLLRRTPFLFPYPPPPPTPQHPESTWDFARGLGVGLEGGGLWRGGAGASNLMS